jgi:hypothetical protein
MELAEKYSKDPVAFDAVLWVAQNVRGSDADSKKVAEKAYESLIQDHIHNEKLTDVVQGLVYSPSPAAEKLMRMAMEKSPHREVQGRATLALAQFLKNRSELVHQLKEMSDEQLPLYENYFGRDVIEQLKETDPDALMKQAEDLCERVVENYTDLKNYRGTLGDAAEGELFEIRNLAIGRVAPDIEGEDLDGAGFKLSDYRGKVVVLDFWGNW